MKVNGACHCGSVQFEAEIDPEKVMICHCTDCQVLSGTAFRTIVPSLPGTFKLKSGDIKDYVKTGESGNRRRQCFCPECGSSVYASADEADPQVFGLRIGVLDQRDQLDPRLQIWTKSEHDWVDGIGAIKGMEKQ